jgi:uncharacterized membrane protein YfcA
MPSEQMPSRPFFWFGLTLLILTVGPFVFCFLGLISWGVITFPLLLLVCISPMFAIAYLRQWKTGDASTMVRSCQRFGVANWIAVCTALCMSLAFWIIAHFLLVFDEKVDNGGWLAPGKAARRTDF